ncbi:EF-hand domain-containing protein [Chachezhania sediminis]|uniref:EF-hand domain-containing protein n=1 Tax=Chachezhania sediminis TaxID=2599291 RepID=UPI00131AC975|nr:EF-hand domain-containing protein [Chachezhania sediminis]
MINKIHVKPIAAMLALSVGVLSAGSALAFGPGGQPGSGHGPRGMGPGPMMMKMTFQEIDTDGNGVITYEELRLIGPNRAAEGDTDGDGALSLEEVQAMAMSRAAERAAMMFQKMDKDGDGLVQLSELPRPRGTGMIFDRMDRDNDGSITEVEFEVAKVLMAEHMQDRMKKGGSQHGPDGGCHGGYRGHGGHGDRMQRNAPGSQAPAMPAPEQD